MSAEAGPAVPSPATPKGASGHIRLTSHSGGFDAPPIRWGAPTAAERGPVIGTTTKRAHRNVIGTHSGSYSVYRALAVAAGALSREHKADLTDTAPTDVIGPFPQWSEPGRIVSLDPWGAMVADAFAADLAAGYDIRPTIAITKAHVIVPEIMDAVQKGRLRPDGQVLLPSGAALVTKVAIEPVWYLPGVAQRFGCSETDLRRVLFEETGGMYPELVTRSDLEVFLPPIGGQTIYIFGNGQRPRRSHRRADRARPRRMQRLGRVRLGHLHLPPLSHACDRGMHPGRAARRGWRGGLLRKEGRALGEVTKFLVYNARKRQVGGDTAEAYFARTECVAGVQDMRFQELMPDVLHWLGIRKIHRLVSMSNMKYDAITGFGHRGRRAREHPRRADPARRARGDRRQDGGRLLHPGPGARHRGIEEAQGPGVGRMSLVGMQSRPGHRHGPRAPPRRCAPRPPCASVRSSCCTALATATRAGSACTTTRCRRPRSKWPT